MSCPVATQGGCGRDNDCNSFTAEDAEELLAKGAEENQSKRGRSGRDSRGGEIVL